MSQGQGGPKLKKSTSGKRMKSVEAQLPHFGLRRVALPNGGTVVRDRKTQKAIDAQALRETMKGWKEGAKEAKEELEKEGK